MVGLTATACDVITRQSGWLLGGDERRAAAAGPSEPSPVSAPSKAPAAVTTTAPSTTPLATAMSGKSATSEKAPTAGKAKTGTEKVLGSGVFIEEKPQQTTSPPSTTSGTVTLNFVDADVRDVIKTVLGGTLNKNFVIDPKVKGAITLQTASPIARRDILPTLEAALRLNDIALVESDSLYRVVPSATASRRADGPRIAGLSSARGEGFGVEIVPLKFAAAADIAKILEPLTPPEALLKTDTVRNMLIVSGTRRERAAIDDIVSIFDVDWLSGMSVAMVPLDNAQPKEVIADLKRIFGANKGGPLEGAVRFFPVDRRNAVLVISAQPEYIDKANAWISRLDVGGSDEKRLYVYSVENARAIDLATILGQVFSDGSAAAALPTGTTVPGRQQARLSSHKPFDTTSFGKSDSTFGTSRSSTINAQALGPPLSAAQASSAPASRPAAPPAAAPGAAPGSAVSSDTLPEELTARIIPDDINNSLVIMARPQVWRMIEEALHKLDIVPLQVMIEATVAEVTLNDELRYGLQSFFSQGNNSAAFSTGTSTTLSSTFPGFSYVFHEAGGTEIQAVLDALDSITDVKVISSPKILVLDNRTAELQVGDQVPISTRQAINTTDPNAPTVNQIELHDTGVVLRVTPRVNASGLVSMEIEQEESNPVQTTSSGIDSPTIQQRRLRSSVAVNSGATIALGGLIRDTREHSISGIPILSSIPVLGNLFSSTSKSGKRTELLVLITPRVVRNQGEARAVTRDLRRILHNAAALYRTGLGVK